MAVHYSSKDHTAETPQDFFERLNREFRFRTDVCALPHNAKCKRYFTPEQDGLKQEWRGTCWMNPPYGREIPKWIRKAYESSRGGGRNRCLPRARAHRHRLVARLLCQRRDPLHSWSSEIQQPQTQRAVSVRARGLLTSDRA